MAENGGLVVLQTLEYQRKAKTCQENEIWLEAFYWYSAALDINYKGHHNKILDATTKATLNVLTPLIKSELSVVSEKVEDLYSPLDEGLSLSDQFNYDDNFPALPPSCSANEFALYKVGLGYYLQARVAVQKVSHLLSFYCYNRSMDALLAVSECLGEDEVTTKHCITHRMNDCWKAQMEVGNTIWTSLERKYEPATRDKSSLVDSVLTKDDASEMGSVQQACVNSLHSALINHPNFTSDVKSAETGNIEKTNDQKILEQMVQYFEAKMISKSNLGNHSWDDAVGLEYVKIFVQGKMMLGEHFPNLFESHSAVSNNVLFYGPPGTGKTLIAKIIASQISATFLPVTASDIKSKYVGEGEKKIKSLFTAARKHSPCVIFMDEGEAILSSRPEDKANPDAILTEFLIQTEGVDPTMDNSRIYVIAATNLPWNIDKGVDRRFPARIMIGLPTETTRNAVLKYHISQYKKLTHCITEDGFLQLAKYTQYYSNADLSALANDIAFNPWLKALKATHFMLRFCLKKGKTMPKPGVVVSYEDDFNQTYTPCESTHKSARKMSIFDIKENELRLPNVTLEDAMMCAKSRPPTLSGIEYDTESDSSESEADANEAEEIDSGRSPSDSRNEKLDPNNEGKTGKRKKTRKFPRGSEQLKKYFDYYKESGTKFPEINEQYAELREQRKALKKATGNDQSKSLPFFLKKAKQNLKKQQQMEELGGIQYDMLFRFLRYEASSLLQKCIQLETEGIRLEKVDIEPEKIQEVLLGVSRKLITLAANCKVCRVVFGSCFPGHSICNGSTREIEMFFLRLTGIYQDNPKLEARSYTSFNVTPKTYRNRKEAETLKLVCGKLLNMASGCKNCRKKFDEIYPGQKLENYVQAKPVNVFISCLFSN